MNKKRWYILSGEFIVIEILAFMVQNFLTISTQSTTLKIIVDYAIIIGTALAIIVVIINYLYWYFSSLHQKVNYLWAVQKYYDMILIKYESINPSNPVLIFDSDMHNFTEKERKYLNTYFKNKNNRLVIMKGNNKTLGMFM